MSPHPAAAPNGLCISCNEPLIIPLEDEAETTGAAGITDDIELPCGHHYHWSCFADAYSSDAATPGTKRVCPSCRANILDAASGKLLATYRNEGGVQAHLDLGAMLDEEEFYDLNPELKKVRAFLEFCAEGDLESVVDMLGEDGGLLNVQDFETGQTGLHVAVQNQREDVIQVLLQRGVDRGVLDAQGRSYYQLAIELGADEVQLGRLGGGS